MYEQFNNEAKNKVQRPIDLLNFHARTDAIELIIIREILYYIEAHLNHAMSCI